MKFVSPSTQATAACCSMAQVKLAAAALFKLEKSMQRFFIKASAALSLLASLSSCAIIITDVHTQDEVQVCTGDLEFDLKLENEIER